MARRQAGGPAAVGLGDLSARQMLVPSLVGTVADVLRRTGVDASMLQLEVTETVVMDDVDHFHEVLSRLRALGIHLSMDDFGTGYSSIRHLRESRSTP